jgi:hypothetical protein
MFTALKSWIFGFMPLPKKESIIVNATTTITINYAPNCQKSVKKLNFKRTTFRILIKDVIFVNVHAFLCHFQIEIGLFSNRNH